MQEQDKQLSSIKAYFDREMVASDIAPEEHRPLFKLLVCDLLGRPATDLLLADRVTLSEPETNQMMVAINGLKAGRPIQYIIGHTSFYGLAIQCDERALIPRPETEELVRWIIDKNAAASSILDIGTGTGCIPLALAKHIKQAHIHAVDVSTDALALAGLNADRLNLPVEFILDNILEPTYDYQRYEVIVSNPPYVRDLEKSEMSARVLDHEPHLALFVRNEEPLLFYQSIALFAKEQLVTGGNLYFEINEYLGESTSEMLIDLGFQEVTIRKDLNGKHRMLRGTWIG